MGNPGHLQIIHVLFVNLIEGGEAVTVGGIAPVRPVFLLLTRCDRFYRYRLIRRHQRLRLEHPAEAHQHHDRQNGRDAKRRCFVRGVVVCCAHKRPDDGTEEGQHGKRKEAREERPEIPSGIADGPEQRGDKRDAIEDDPLARLMKIRTAAITIATPMIRKYPLPPTVTSFKPKPPTARPMSIISPARSHCRIRGIPRGALPNAISVSFKSPRCGTVPNMYQLGNNRGGGMRFYMVYPHHVRLNSCLTNSVRTIW